MAEEWKLAEPTTDDDLRWFPPPPSTPPPPIVIEVAMCSLRCNYGYMIDPNCKQTSFQCDTMTGRDPLTSPKFFGPEFFNSRTKWLIDPLKQVFLRHQHHNVAVYQNQHQNQLKSWFGQNVCAVMSNVRNGTEVAVLPNVPRVIGGRLIVVQNTICANNLVIQRMVNTTVTGLIQVGLSQSSDR